MLAYRLRHPFGLTARYHQTTFVTPGESTVAIVRQAAWNWLQDLDPFYWLVGRGDPKPYTDVAGGQLLAVSVLFALVGIAVAVVALPATAGALGCCSGSGSRLFPRR